MGDEKVRKVLKSFGLTEKETEVYIFLAKHGVKRSGEIAKGLKTHRAEVYRMLKSLQTKGLTQPTLESPTRFTTVPFETVIDSFIKTKREEAASVESAKRDLLEDWKIISRRELEPQPEKFVVIEGNRKIYPKILQMIKETENQFSVIATVPSLVHTEQFGLFDAAFAHPLKTKIQFRFLTELSEQNLNFVKTLLKRIPKRGFNFKGRNPALGLTLSPRMVMRDEKEILFFITPRPDSSAPEQEETGLWTNCRTLVQSFTAVFEDLWRNSTDINKKITEIETGKPTPETRVIEDAEASAKYVDTMRSAEKEITIMTSSEGLVRYWKNKPLLKEWDKRGVSVRIMAPIVSQNLQTAQKLLKYCAVRHVPVGYLETAIVDGKYLFQFENQPANEKKRQAKTFFENVFYTNDIDYVEKTKKMLNDIWSNTFAPSAITLDSILKPPMPQAAPLSDDEYAFSRPESPYKKMNHGLKEKAGVITEKDVLNKIINAKKYPSKNWPKGMLRFYGSDATAVIHPPDYFNLPGMIIWVLHYDKQSSFGAQDLLIAYLWLETPKGHAYVPVALVTDNPTAMDFLKDVYAGTPAGHNIQLFKNDEFQVRVHGKILFAGWTAPIPLRIQSYILPPSCILFEAYSKLKPLVVEIGLPSGVKINAEANGFEAFVTFFHQSSKYSGPGTDGTLGRDIVVTINPPDTTKP